MTNNQCRFGQLHLAYQATKNAIGLIDKAGFAQPGHRQDRDHQTTWECPMFVPPIVVDLSWGKNQDHRSQTNPWGLNHPSSVFMRCAGGQRKSQAPAATRLCSQSSPLPRVCAFHSHFNHSKKPFRYVKENTLEI